MLRDYVIDELNSKDTIASSSAMLALDILEGSTSRRPTFILSIYGWCSTGYEELWCKTANDYNYFLEGKGLAEVLLVCNSLPRGKSRG